ncbi:uncharacterized protein LOC121711204 [Alosa sapidissima]|uniref:uncharacterized protein LOC121711204 n=1 Tax=Alosa sapidissima TaxID=34773 RepID=UPI001C08D920|nr:uncharacterized protein LOC121711204 [Alosa sapidissima]
MLNKDALASYAGLYPPIVTPVARRSYVAWIRKQKVGARSRMEALKMYVPARDKEPKTAPEPAHVLPPPGASSSDPSDTELLAAAAIEVDSPSPHVQGRPTSCGPLFLSLSSHWKDQEWLFSRLPPAKSCFPSAGGRRFLKSSRSGWAEAVVVSARRPAPLHAAPATAHAFFQHPFFLWMPYRMWAYHLTCFACGRKLMGAGLYRTVRRVLDRSGRYRMGTDYLQCPSCHKKVTGCSQDILEQLDIEHREQFPAVLTYKLSCDRAVSGLLKERTLGNGVARLPGGAAHQEVDGAVDAISFRAPQS